MQTCIEALVCIPTDDESCNSVMSVQHTVGMGRNATLGNMLLQSYVFAGWYCIAVLCDSMCA